MIQFDYSNEKYSIPAGAPESAMDEARRFMSELRSRLDDDTVILAVSLETDKRFAGLAVCSRETKEFVPDNRLIIRDHSSSLYEHDPDKGTITFTTYDSGDKNVREHKKGVLADFFLKKSNHPSDIFYNLLLEEGFEPESLMLQTHYWTDLRELGAVEKDDAMYQRILDAAQVSAKPQELRKRLRIAEGGDVYLFGTTTAGGEHRLLFCTKRR